MNIINLRFYTLILIRILLLLSFLLLSQLLVGQESFLLKGKIVSESAFLEDVHVINQTKSIGETTLRGGYFSISASVNDTLIFSAVHLKSYLHIVKEEDKTKDLLFVPMEALMTQLEEINLVKYQNITPEALGIIPEGIKKYTPAERKLAAAGEFKWYSPLLIPVGGMSVDGLINSISGRTSMLKKELAVERKEMLLEDVKFYYDREFIVNKLQIPEEYVEAFYFYILDETEFTKPFKDRNMTLSEFVLSKLSTKYLDIIKQ